MLPGLGVLWFEGAALFDVFVKHLQAKKPVVDRSIPWQCIARTRPYNLKPLSYSPETLKHCRCLRFLKGTVQ